MNVIKPVTISRRWSHGSKPKQTRSDQIGWAAANVWIAFTRCQWETQRARRRQKAKVHEPVNESALSYCNASRAVEWQALEKSICWQQWTVTRKLGFESKQAYFYGRTAIRQDERTHPCVKQIRRPSDEERYASLNGTVWRWGAKWKKPIGAQR